MDNEESKNQPFPKMQKSKLMLGIGLWSWLWTLLLFGMLSWLGSGAWFSLCFWLGIALLLWIGIGLWQKLELGLENIPALALAIILAPILAFSLGSGLGLGLGSVLWLVLGICLGSGIGSGLGIGLGFRLSDFISQPTFKQFPWMKSHKALLFELEEAIRRIQCRKSGISAKVEIFLLILDANWTFLLICLRRNTNRSI